jgi:hypothetical protein
MAEVEVEVARELVGDPNLRSRAERALRETIGCSIAVTLQAPGTVPARRVASCSASSTAVSGSAVAAANRLRPRHDLILACA